MKERLRRIPGVMPFWRARPMQAARISVRNGYAWVNRRLIPRVRAFKHRKTLRLMITGTKGKTTTTTMLASIMAEAGYRVGYCTTDNVVIEGEVIAVGDYAGIKGPRIILNTPTVDCAVLETARGGLRKRGLYVSSCHAAALLNIGLDHIGQDGIDSLETMLAHKKQVTDAAFGRVILNAEDSLVAPLWEEYSVQRSTLFAIDPAAVADHLARGGEAVTLTGGPTPRMVHRGPSGETDIMAVTDLPAAMGGNVPFIVANALATIALARAVGIGADVIATALGRIDLSSSGIPGRFQSIEGFPFDVFVDRGHDPAGLAGFFEGVAGARRSDGAIRAMMTAPGNRPDWYFKEVARIAKEAGVEIFVLFDSDVLRREREPGEIPKRMADWLLSSGVAQERISEHRTASEAVSKMISEATPGDVLCFLGEHVKQDLRGLVLAELGSAGYAEENKPGPSGGRSAEA